MALLNPMDRECSPEIQQELNRRSVLQDWVMKLPLMQQALVCTAIRGPDGVTKHNQAKIMTKYLRGATLNAAHPEWVGKNGSFMWQSEEDYHRVNPTTERLIFVDHSLVFLNDHDAFPHHWFMHFIHVAEVVGYKHPNPDIRKAWLWFYQEACLTFHMTPETVEQMDARLNF